MTVVMVVTVLLCSFTLLPNKVVGQCEWTGWGTCHPSILLGLLDPVSALQYEAIMMDVNLGEAERKTLVMQWAQNQDPLVWETLKTYWQQRGDVKTAVQKVRQRIMAYLSTEAQELTNKLLAIALDNSLTKRQQSAQISTLMNSASAQVRDEILYLEEQVALFGAMNDPYATGNVPSQENDDVIVGVSLTAEEETEIALDANKIANLIGITNSDSAVSGADDTAAQQTSDQMEVSASDSSLDALTDGNIDTSADIVAAVSVSTDNAAADNVSSSVATSTKNTGIALVAPADSAADLATVADQIGNSVVEGTTSAVDSRAIPDIGSDSVGTVDSSTVVDSGDGDIKDTGSATDDLPFDAADNANSVTDSATATAAANIIKRGIQDMKSYLGSSDNVAEENFKKSRVIDYKALGHV